MIGKTNTAHYHLIADAIREKNQQETLYFPAQMAEAIRRIDTSDWIPIKNALIAQLNEQFNLNLRPDATPDEILAAIATLENPVEVKQFFIDLLNANLLVNLSIDDSYDDIALNVTTACESMRQDAIEFQTLNRLVKALSDDFITNPSIIAEPEYLDYVIDIRDYMQTAVNSLVALYGG